MSATRRTKRPLPNTAAGLEESGVHKVPAQAAPTPERLSPMLSKIIQMLVMPTACPFTKADLKALPADMLKSVGVELLALHSAVVGGDPDDSLQYTTLLLARRCEAMGALAKALDDGLVAFADSHDVLAIDTGFT